MSPPALVVSQAIGYATNRKQTFNDVQEYGHWPSHLDIKKVTEITLYTGNAEVNGIEIIYDTTSDKTVLHGKRLGKPNLRRLQANEFFVGFFGAMDDKNSETGYLRRIGFLVYDKVTGDMTSFGPFPDLPSDSDCNPVKGFGSLGLIAGFSGTTAENGKLDTLAVYKFLSADKEIGLSAGL